MGSIITKYNSLCEPLECKLKVLLSFKLIVGDFWMNCPMFEKLTDRE